METLKKRIILLRHEERPSDPGFETHLTRHGLNRSKTIPSRLQDTNNVPSLIYSSPFLRCLETIQSVYQSTKADICVENALSEWFLPTEPEDVKRIRALTDNEIEFYNVQEQYNSITKITDIPASETQTQLRLRVKTFLQSLLEKNNDSKNISDVDDSSKKILIVSHQSIIEEILQELNCLDYPELEMGCLIQVSPFKIF